MKEIPGVQLGLQERDREPTVASTMSPPRIERRVCEERAP